MTFKKIFLMALFYCGNSLPLTRSVEAKRYEEEYRSLLDQREKFVEEWLDGTSVQMHEYDRQNLKRALMQVEEEKVIALMKSKHSSRSYISMLKEAFDPKANVDEFVSFIKKKELELNVQKLGEVLIERAWKKDNKLEEKRPSWKFWVR